MSEISRRREVPEGERRERLRESRETPDALKESLTEIDRLLAELLEKGAEWDAHVRSARRVAILNLMQSIGIQGFDDLDGFAKVHERAYRAEATFPPASPETLQDFADPKGYFSTLGVEPSSLKGKTEPEIKSLLRKQYWMLAKKYHPLADKGESIATGMMQGINIAYDVLSHTSKRAEYLHSG